jgi:hypothetical protein
VIMDSKHFAMSVTVTLSLIAMTAVVMISYPIGQEINAQNMTAKGDHGEYGNKTSGQYKTAINGTINLHQTIFEAIGAKVNTTLAQAITSAEESIGNNSFAMAAFGGPVGPYFAYTIILGTPGMEFHKVIVDPGTGQVLASQEISEMEWMKMQQMHHMMSDGGHGGPGGGPDGMGKMFMQDGGPMKRDRGW